MARKAVKRRADGDEAANLQADYTSVASSPDLHRSPEELRAADPGRTSLLLAYTPENNVDLVSQVRDSVVDLILRVEYVSWDSDQAMLKIGYGYATHCVRTYGEWVPARHLLDGPIEQWTSRPGKSANTRSSEYAALRRLRTGRRATAKFSRNVATPPYGNEEWKRFRAIAESRVNRDATALAYLSGELGLRAHEIGSATGHWIHMADDRTWLSIPDRQGVIRLVPAFGDVAGWLRSMHHVGGDYLMRPKRKWRPSLITDVRYSIRSKYPEFSDFNVLSARHLYITNLLDTATPLSVVFHVAGLKPGASLPLDLLKYLDDPSDERVYQCLQRVDRHRGRPAPSLIQTNTETSQS